MMAMMKDVREDIERLKEKVFQYKKNHIVKYQYIDVHQLHFEKAVQNTQIKVNVNQVNVNLC